jgi:hypothetical protein
MNCIRYALVFLFFIAVLGLNYCVKSEGSHPDAIVDCENLNNGIIFIQPEKVNTEINKLTFNLLAKPVENDLTGQKENLNTLIGRINKNCIGLKASLSCFACIETLPVQSEILIEADSMGIPVKRLLDISTPANDVLECISVHR